MPYWSRSPSHSQPAAGYLQFWLRDFFLGPYCQQSVCWFLGVLLMLFVILAAFYCAEPSLRAIAGPQLVWPRRSGEDRRSDAQSWLPAGFCVSGHPAKPATSGVLRESQAEWACQWGEELRLRLTNDE